MNNNNLQKIKILLLLGPYENFYPEMLAKRLNSFLIGLDNNWKIFALTRQIYNESIVSKYLNCQFKIIEVPSLLPLKYELGWMFSIKNLFGYFTYLISSIIYGIKIINKENINVVYMRNNFVQLMLVIYIISKITKRKCICRISADFLIPLIYFLKETNNFLLNKNIILKIISLIYRKLEIIIITRCDMIVTHSPMDYKKFKKITNKIKFIPLWVDTTKFKYIKNKKHIEKFKNKLINNNKDKVILFVGRYHPEKGIGTLLKAFQIIYNKYDNISLILIGSGDYMEIYKKMARNLKIYKKTYFLGYISHYELPIYYNISDLFILPSLREAWSVSLMEALACKIPSIVTNTGANPYLIVEQETGFLIPPRNSKILAEKIEFVLENPLLSKKVSDNALKMIKKYDIKKIGELHKSVIKNLLAH